MPTKAQKLNSAKQKRWREASVVNKKKKSTWSVRWQRANPEKATAIRAKWKAAHPKREIALVAQWRKTINGRSHVMRQAAVANAKRKGLAYDLTHQWVAERLERGACELSGLPFVFLPRGDQKQHPYAPSIDRVDSSGGYTQKNCRVVLCALNLAFNHWGSDEFLPIARAFVKSAR